MDETGNAVPIAGLTLDASRHEAFLEGQPIGLTKTEFRILLFLVQGTEGCFPEKEIILAVQGDDYPVTDQSIDNHVMLLRRSAFMPV